MTHKEIVMKLVGEVRPVGESNEDTARFENLKQLCELTNQLLYEISMVEFDFKDRYEFSLRRASEYAKEWMNKTGVVE